MKEVLVNEGAQVASMVLAYTCSVGRIAEKATSAGYPGLLASDAVSLGEDVMLRRKSLAAGCRLTVSAGSGVLCLMLIENGLARCSGALVSALGGHIPSGNALLIEEGHAELFVFDSTATILVLSVSANVVREIISGVGGEWSDGNTQRKIFAPKRFAEVLNKILRDEANLICNNTAHIHQRSSFQKNNLIYALSFDIFEIAPKNRGFTDKDEDGELPNFKAAIDQIEVSDLTMDYIIEKLSIPQKKVRENIKAAFGVTFQKYVNHRRLRYAVEMLKKTDKSLVEIAIDAGYCSQAHFSSAFLKQYGTSPGKFRRSFEIASGREGMAKALPLDIEDSMGEMLSR